MFQRERESYSNPVSPTVFAHVRGTIPAPEPGFAISACHVSPRLEAWRPVFDRGRLCLLRGLSRFRNIGSFRVALRKQRRSLPVLLVEKGHPLQTLTIKQAAELKAVSTKTIRRWISLGLLPAERLGPRLIRIRHDDLEAVGRRIPAA